MRRNMFFALLLGATSATVGFTALDAGADQHQALDCTYEIKEFTISPGVGKEDSSGVVETDGQAGTLTCGDAKGTIGFTGGYGTTDPDNCTDGGEGTGVFNYTLDDKKSSTYVTYTYGGLEGGAVTVAIKGAEMNGTSTVTPVDGDCATTPITKASGLAKVKLTVKE